MPQISITVEPWKGHACPPQYEHRATKRLDADASVCVMRDGMHQDVAAEDVAKGDLICVGSLYRVVEEPREVEVNSRTAAGVDDGNVP
jgi:hypothetical protein